MGVIHCNFCKTKIVLPQKGHKASAKAEKVKNRPRDADQSKPPGFVLETCVSWR